MSEPKGQMKVKIVKIIELEMNEDQFNELHSACFHDGDRQMLNELVDLDCEGDLYIYESGGSKDLIRKYERALIQIGYCSTIERAHKIVNLSLKDLALA